MDKKELLPPGLAYLADNIVTKHNLLGAKKGEGSRWAKNLDLPKESETIFFAGCGYQYTGELETLMSLIRKIDKSVISTEMTMGLANFQKKLGFDASGLYRKAMTRGSDAEAQPLRDAVKVLRKLGVEFGYLAEDEPCCGGLLHYIGLQKEFAANSRQTHDGFESKGIKKIISIIPSCTATLKNLIPASINEEGVEVKHFTEVVVENMAGHKMRFPRKVRVAYHDSCQLARVLGLIDEPRQILEAIENIELVESEWTSGECTTCCGGGGGFEAVFPELSQILATNRTTELIEGGVDVIITQCPGCIMQIKDGLKELNEKGIEVLDLAQVVAMALED